MENNKEMDLFDLIEKIGNLFARFFKFLTKTSLQALKFNIKKAYIIIPFIIIGFFIAQYLINPKNRTYYAEFRLKVNVSDSHSFYSLIESLNTLVEFYPDSAAKTLNISQSEIKKIREIKPGFLIDNNNNGTPDFVDFEDNFEEKDTLSVRMNEYLGVRIDGRSRLGYEKIQEKIISYLNNEPYSKKETEVYQHIQLQKASEIENQIKSLTQHSNSSDFDPNTNKIKIEENTVSLKKNTSYTKELINLMKLQEEIIKNNQIYSDAVTAISPVVVKTKHGKVFYYSVIIGFMYLMSIIVGLLISNKKDVVKFLKED